MISLVDTPETPPWPTGECPKRPDCRVPTCPLDPHFPDLTVTRSDPLCPYYELILQRSRFDLIPSFLFLPLMIYTLRLIEKGVLGPGPDKIPLHDSPESPETRLSDEGKG